jgi:hypothetical protein
MRADQIRGLMEAYSKVHETPDVTGEEIQEWANSLIAEGYDLSEYTFDELYEAYIEEQGGRRGTGGGAEATSREVGAVNRALGSAASAVGQSLQRANTVPSARPAGARQNLRGGGSRPIGATPAAKPATTPAATKPTATPAPVTKPAAKPATTPAATKPTATSSAKPTATSSAKPTATPSAKPSGSAMDQWAKANPKLAAAKAERDRTRGTSATTNPLMKDMKSRLPAPKSEDVDIFDLVKGYLLDEGYAETEEGAMVMMVNMSEGWRESILEVLGGQSGDGYIGHPRLGIKNPMSAPKKPVTSAPKNTGVAGQLGNRAAAMDAAMKQLRNSYEVEGEQLDEISTRLAGKVVNARIERTGAAVDRENKARTPQNVRDTVAAADKESRAKRLAAGVRKRRSQTNEELETWVEELTAEGYDLSGYTQEEVAEIYAQELELSEAMTSYEKNRKRAAQRAAARNEARKQGKTGVVPGVGYVSSRPERETWTDEGGKERHKTGARMPQKEEYVDESQHARENPEGHDKEEKKKYEKVRGEKTPMPPRGDKRREDFEKWYRANVR